MRHRLVLSYEALADRVTADELIAKVVEAVSAPENVGHAPDRSARP
jgi:hypothetical protein